MLTRLRTIGVTLMLTLTMSGCQSLGTKADFEGFKSEANFATLETIYHNVATIKNDGTNYLFDLVNIGSKQAWFEYDGIIRLGIDANKINVAGPDENNCITVSLPEVEILGTPDVDENSFSELYTDKGIFTQVTLGDQSEALKLAQEEMRKTAESDTELFEMANKRAKQLIEQYIKNVGQAQGITYTVVFE